MYARGEYLQPIIISVTYYLMILSQPSAALSAWVDVSASRVNAHAHESRVQPWRRCAYMSVCGCTIVRAGLKKSENF